MSQNSITENIDALIEENAALKRKIEDAKNCLVCAPIADPYEVCSTTLAILES